MKMTLAEFDEFQKSLTDDWYFDGDGEYINPEFWEDEFDPSEIVDIPKDGIYIAWQGLEANRPKKDNLEFTNEFRKWKGGIDYEIVFVKIPKDKKEEFLKMVKEKYGGVK